MKNLFPIYLIFLSITIIIVISTFADASTYVSFSDAKSLYSVGKKSPIHVVGRLIKNEKNQVIGIDNNNNKIEYKTTKEEIIIKTEEIPNEDEAIKKEEEIIIAKIIDSDFSFNEKKVEIKEVEKKDIIVDAPKIEETIKRLQGSSDRGIY